MSTLQGITSPKKAIFNYKESSKSYRDLFYNIKRVYTRYLLEKCLTGWARWTYKSKEIKQKTWTLQCKAGGIGNECFRIWRDKFIKRRNHRKIINNLFNIIILNLKHKFLARMATAYSDKVHEEYGSKRASQFFIKNLKRRALRAWVNRTKRTLLRKQNELIASSIYYQSLVRRGFYGLTNYFAEKRLALVNHQKSLLFYAFQLKKLPFFAWKKFYFKKVLLASAVEGYQQLRKKRLAPTIIENFKINYYIAQFNRVAIPRADNTYCKNLLVKGLWGFKLNYNSEVVKRHQQEKAYAHYICQLLMKSLRSWLAYLIEKKQHEDKRAILYDTVQRVDNQNLLGYCFNVLKVYKEEAQEYLVDLRTIMIENGLRRILRFWKNYSDQKKYTQNVIQDYRRLSFERKKIEYFQRWRRAFKLRALVYTTLRISFLRSFRTYFNTWKRAVKAFAVYEVFAERKNKEIKGKFWDLWKEYTRKTKLENEKSLIIFDKQAKKTIKEAFNGWRTLFTVVKFVRGFQIILKF